MRVAAAASAGVAMVLVAATAAYATTWQVTHPPFASQNSTHYAPLAAVSAVSATNAWAVGRADGAAYTVHWNGSTWSTVSLPAGVCDLFESDCQLTGVSADPAGDVIAVGTALYPGAGWEVTPLAYRWSGGAWAAMPTPSGAGAYEFGHVKTFSATEAWAVGASSTTGTPAANYWNGTSWTSVPTPTLTTLGLTMNAISGSSGQDVWAVGLAQSSGYRHVVRNSVAMHYNGTSWTAVSVPETQGLLDIAVTSPTNAWATGFNGSVLHWDGTSWTIVTNQPYAHVVAANSATDVWVGGILSVAHFDGSTWTTTTPVPAGMDVFNGAAEVPSGKVWFAGGYYMPDGASTGPAILND
jgi:hypothetical protein